MRLRNVPGSREAIAENKMAINEPTLLKGQWNKEFENDNPIRIEIGMGKGKFITTLAQENPDCFSCYVFCFFLYNSILNINIHNFVKVF